VSNAIACMEKLDGHSLELDELSKGLAETERKLEPVEKQYEAFLDDFETAAWDRHVKDDAKLPPKDMRLRLARREMPSDLLGQHSALHAKRRRIEKRIGSLKAEIDAQRSILSALKLEAEASGNRLGRAA
jgi:chromosome segregation ATPase